MNSISPVQRESREPILAGALGAFLIALSLLKALSWDEIRATDSRHLYLAAGVAELLLGAALLAGGGLWRRWAWRLSLSFCILLFVYAFLARPIPDCKCFGAIADLGAAWRTAVAALMCLVAIQGQRALPSTGAVSRIQIQFRALGAIFGIAFLASLITFNRPEADIPRVEGESSQVVVGGLEDFQLEAITRVPVGQAPLDSTALLTHGRLVDERGRLLSVDGELRHSPGPLGPLGRQTICAVLDGRFDGSFPGISAGNRARSANEFLFTDTNGGLSRPVSMRWTELDSKGPELTLEFADEVIIEVSVVDLRGDAVTGAEVRVACPVPLSLPSGLKTDEAGIALARIRASGDSFRLRISKEGYVESEVVVPRAATSRTVSVSLRRLLGVGVVVDARYRMAALAGFPTGADETIPGVDWSSLTARIESAAELMPFERVEWTVFGEGNRWLEDQSVPVGIQVYGEYVSKIDAPLQQLNPSSFELVRPPAGLVNGYAPLSQVDIRIEPEAAFRAAVPTWLWMSWRVVSGESHEFLERQGGPPGKDRTVFGAPGRRMDGNLFRFWLPSAVLAPKSEVNPRSRTQRAPIFAEGQTVVAVEGAPEQSISLATDECYAGFRLVDEAGLPLDVAAAFTVELPAAPSFVPGRSTWPWRQWVRRGTYEVWGIDTTTRRTIRLAQFHWPVDSATEDETIDLVVDLSRLDIPMSNIR